MSTTPGDSTWTDAGLVPLDGDEPEEVPPVDEVTDPDEQEAVPADDASVEEPDLPLDASEGDVLEQRLAVPDDGTDDYRE